MKICFITAPLQFAFQNEIHIYTHTITDIPFLSYTQTHTQTQNWILTSIYQSLILYDSFYSFEFVDLAKSPSCDYILSVLHILQWLFWMPAEFHFDSRILNSHTEKKNPLDYKHTGIKVIFSIHSGFEITIKSQ